MLVPLLCHTARRDPAFLQLLLAACQDAEALDVPFILTVLQPVLPQDLLVLDFARFTGYYPFAATASCPRSCAPTLCHGVTGFWSYGHVLPAAAPTEPEPVPAIRDTSHFRVPDASLPGSAPVASLPPLSLDVFDVPSFVGCLGCLAPLSFDAMCQALQVVGLGAATRTNSLEPLAALVAQLVLAFPHGIFVRDTAAATYWLLFQGAVQQSSRPDGSFTHLFLDRDRTGCFHPRIHISSSSLVDFTFDLPFSTCYVAFWDSVQPSGSADCFFHAIGFDRSTVIDAILGAPACLPRTQPQILWMLRRISALRDPSAFVSGLDIDMFVQLLPNFFPRGLLLLLNEGVLLYFTPGAPPCSLLPVPWLSLVALFLRHSLACFVRYLA